MNIFDKRPLSLILCVMLGGFVVFSFVDCKISLIILTFALLSSILTFLFKNLSKYRIISIILTSVTLISALASYVYFDKYFKVYERFDEDVEIEGEVISVENPNTYTTTVTIKCDNIENTPLSGCKIIARLQNEEYDVFVGDKITFIGKLSEFNTEDGFDAKSYYFSKGISASVKAPKEINISRGSSKSLEAILMKLRETVRRKSILCSDKYSGNLLSALLTGERSELSGQLRLDFMRIGISHVLALSGMHLAILALAVERILGILGLGKRGRLSFVIIFSLLYMFFVGYTVSVVRAGIMLIISCLLTIVREDKDSVTSLLLAVLLICFFTPYAIYDISLWLSAFATLGVILSMKETKFKTDKISRKRKILLIIKDSIVASVFANALTLLISIKSFGGFSLLSPFSTLIFSYLIEAYMYLGSLMLLLSLIYMPLSLPLGKILIFLSSLIGKTAEILSSLDFSYVSSGYGVLIPLITVFTLLFFILIILPLKRNKQRFAMLAVFLCFASIWVTAGIYKLCDTGTDTLIYQAADKSDVFLIKSDKKKALISSSQYSSGLTYKALELLKDENVTELDVYVVTHYAYGLEEDLSTLLKTVQVNKISLPHPRNESETAIYNLINKEFSDYRVNITLHNAGGFVEIGNFDLMPLYSTAYGEGSSTNAFLIYRNGEMNTLYLSSGMIDKSYYKYYSNVLDDVETIVYGAHGKKYKSSVYIDDRYDTLKEMILSGEEIYLKQSTYIEYTKSGCKINSHPQRVEIINAKN